MSTAPCSRDARVQQWREAEPMVSTRRHVTPREREVLGHVIAGASNKEAGRTLGISPRTIEVHRARIMDKLGAKNAADLVRIVLGHRRRHCAKATVDDVPQRTGV